MSSRSASSDSINRTITKEELEDANIVMKNEVESRWENINTFTGSNNEEKKKLLKENKEMLIKYIDYCKSLLRLDRRRYNGLVTQSKEEQSNKEYMLRELNRIFEYFNEQEQKLKIYNDIHGIKRRAKNTTKRGGSIIKRLPVKPKAKPKATPVKPKAKPKATPVKPKAKPVKPK
jgi:hypothetical protein